MALIGEDDNNNHCKSGYSPLNTRKSYIKTFDKIKLYQVILISFLSSV